MIFLVLWLILKLFSASRHDSTNRVKFCSILLVIICARSTLALAFSRLSREAGTALTNQLRLKSILPLNAEKMKTILRRNRLTSAEHLQYEQLDGLFVPKRHVTLCLKTPSPTSCYQRVTSTLAAFLRQVLILSKVQYHSKPHELP